MIPGSLNTMMLGGGGLPPDFLELVGTPTTVTAYSNNSTFTVPLPAHQDGDLLVVTVQLADEMGASMGGWSIIGYYLDLSGGQAIRIFTKIAESAAETFVASVATISTASRAGMGFVFRSKTGRVPQIEIVGSGTGDTYPALTPSAGVKKYSFLLGWFGKRNNTSVASPTFPSGYSKIAETSAVGKLSRNLRSAMGYRNLKTNTTTPGAMSYNGISSRTVYIAAVVWEEDE